MRSEGGGGRCLMELSEGRRGGRGAGAQCVWRGSAEGWVGKGPELPLVQSSRKKQIGGNPL